MTYAMIVFGWAAWVGFTPAPPPAPQAAVAPLEGHTSVSPHIAVETRVPPLESPRTHFRGVISAYSCDQHPRNRMYPCGPFRDGTAPHRGLHGVVAACPLEWLGDSVTVEGYGVVRCVDTPRNGWYGDSPHIDLFMNFDAAIQWGIQERTVSK
jgi:hypothetical protein